MTWNSDMNAAPRDGSRLFVALATKQQVINSLWLPSNNKDRPKGRWQGCNADEQPIAWMPWPVHPELL